jgi:hypothetical protein
MAFHKKGDPSQAVVFYPGLLFFPCGMENYLLVGGGFDPKMSPPLISVNGIGKFKPDRLRITSDHVATKPAEDAVLQELKRDFPGGESGKYVFKPRHWVNEQIVGGTIFLEIQ